MVATFAVSFGTVVTVASMTVTSFSAFSTSGIDRTGGSGVGSSFLSDASISCTGFEDSFVPP